MIWWILLGFIFVVLLDAYRTGFLDKIILKIKKWLKQPIGGSKKAR